MNEDETPSTAADIRALAEQAEAEAAEAEALAAAARARGRAIQLRRQADVLDANKEETKKEEASKEELPEDAAAAEEAADSVAADEADTAETEAAEEAEAAVEPASDETAESPTDAVAETDAQAETPAEPEERRWRRISRRVHRPKWSTLAASVAIVIILAALAASGYMIKEHQDAVRKRQLAAEFTAAARQGVVTLTSLDFNDAKAGVQAILDNATGSFKDDFVKTADEYVKTVEQMKVVSQGSVQSVAVDWNTMTADSAEVLVASTQEVTNVAGAKQEPRNYRFVLTISRDGGRLKISKLEFVP